MPTVTEFLSEGYSWQPLETRPRNSPSCAMHVKACTKAVLSVPRRYSSTKSTRLVKGGHLPL